MSFTNIKSTQNKFLESYLRGTDCELSAAQARATYGIMNLRARMAEFRQAGLVVRTRVNTQGKTTYSVSRRTVAGEQFKIFS